MHSMAGCVSSPAGLCRNHSVDALAVSEGLELLGGQKKVEQLRYLPSNLPFSFNQVAGLFPCCSWSRGLCSVQETQGESSFLETGVTTDYNSATPSPKAHRSAWGHPFISQLYPSQRAELVKSKSRLCCCELLLKHTHAASLLLQEAKEGEENGGQTINHIQKSFCSTHITHTHVL